MFKYSGILYNTAGYSNLNTGYIIMDKYFINDNKNDITYSCSVKDSFSVDNEYGNNKLNYSIGLLTIEEAFYAGFVPNNNPKASNYKTLNTNNYLYNNSEFITMTPAYFNGQDAYNFVISKNKVMPGKVSVPYYVRPVIGIKKDTKVIRGNGSVSDPYVLAELVQKESDEE